MTADQIIAIATAVGMHCDQSGFAPKSFIEGLAKRYYEMELIKTDYNAAKHRFGRIKGTTIQIGLYWVTPGIKFNPSRPYQDGVEIVIVYWEQYQSISIYCNPTTEHKFGGTTVANIEFTGPPQSLQLALRSRVHSRRRQARL